MPEQQKPQARFSYSWNMTGGFRRIGKQTMLPREFTARFDDPEDHAVEMTVIVQDVELDGTNQMKPTCSAITVTRNPRLPPLTGSELRALPVPKLVEFACLQVAVARGEGAAWGPVGSQEEAEVAQKDVSRSRRRRRITDELLESVATVYLEEPESGEPHGAERVAKAFNVSVSQAHRYAKQARERGCLPEVGR